MTHYEQVGWLCGPKLLSRPVRCFTGTVFGVNLCCLWTEPYQTRIALKATDTVDIKDTFHNIMLFNADPLIVSELKLIECDWFAPIVPPRVFSLAYLLIF